MADADAPPVEARPADDDLESDDEWPDVSDHEGSRDDGDDASGDEIDISPVATGGRRSAPRRATRGRPRRRSPILGDAGSARLRLLARRGGGERVAPR